MTLVLRHLNDLQALRGQPMADPALAARLSEVKLWQQQRLARTYADLGEDPRYAPAVDFFLNHLYGDKDFARRDAELRRIVPTMVKILPRQTVETVDLALELDALAEGLDQDMARKLPGTAPITEASYCAAFRAVGALDRRNRQVELVLEAGSRLDRVVKKPLVAAALRMLRKPAHMAGLGDLQEFLEAGFAAFKHMGEADHFLATITRRETSIMERIFAGTAAPFNVK
jgi:hypothetical protein